MPEKFRLMTHWNSNILAAVDIETTGLNFERHDIVQVAILPLTVDLVPHPEITPLNLLICPDRPKNAEKMAMKVNCLSMQDLLRHGHPSDIAADMLEHWYRDLRLPMRAFDAGQGQIIPLGHNYSFDERFLRSWLGHDRYDLIFHRDHRDTRTLAAAINDYYWSQGLSVPFNQIGLGRLATLLGVSRLGQHDALCDCKITAEVYRRMLTPRLLSAAV